MYFTCNGPQRSPLLYFYKRGGSFIGYLSRMRDSTVHHWWRIGHFPVRKWPPFLLVYIIAVETCLQQRRKEPSSQASLKSNPPVEWIRAVGRVIVVPKLRPPPEWSLYRWECSRLRLPQFFNVIPQNWFLMTNHREANFTSSENASQYIEIRVPRIQDCLVQTLPFQ